MKIGRTRLIIALALGLFLGSCSVNAQPSTNIPRVGILCDETPALASKLFEPALAEGLRDLGWVEGHNITFERRYAAEKYESLPSLAAELVQLHPDVILAIGTGAARAAKATTQTIPIIFARAGDPIGSGLVSSLARPGGNLTGLSIQYVDIDGKRLQLLMTAVPGAKRVGALWDPNFSTAAPELRVYQVAARALNLELIPVEARGPEDFAPALQAVVQQHAGALVVVPAITFTEHSQPLLDLTAKARLPAVFYRREFVDAGGLMSYGPNLTEMYRRAAAYLDKVLKGAKPADLPVEQPTKFELVINLKTAKSLGLAIPPFLLAQADQVIE
jgi:putative tryptophan/tyrosine transport system substrate-binding protein